MQHTDTATHCNTLHYFSPRHALRSLVMSHTCNQNHFVHSVVPIPTSCLSPSPPHPPLAQGRARCNIIAMSTPLSPVTLSMRALCVWLLDGSTHPLQRSATQRITVQHSATQFNTVQHSATQRNTVQHSATQCNTMHHSAT